MTHITYVTVKWVSLRPTLYFCGGRTLIPYVPQSPDRDGVYTTRRKDDVLGETRWEIIIVIGRHQLEDDVRY